MGVVVTVPHQAEPWKISNAAFRLLAAEVEVLSDDTEFMVRASAAHGLYLNEVSEPERTRQAALLAEGARNLRRALLVRPTRSEWESSLADYLPVLEMWMDGLLDEQA